MGIGGHLSAGKEKPAQRRPAFQKMDIEGMDKICRLEKAADYLFYFFIAARRMSSQVRTEKRAVRNVQVRIIRGREPKHRAAASVRKRATGL